MIVLDIMMMIIFEWVFYGFDVEVGVWILLDWMGWMIDKYEVWVYVGGFYFDDGFVQGFIGFMVCVIYCINNIIL